MLFLDALNSFYEDLDALLIAHDTVMDNALLCYRKALAKSAFHENSLKIQAVLDQRWIQLRDAKYAKLQDLFFALEQKYKKIDIVFEGMTRRLPFLDMIKDLKSMPPDYFAKVKKKSLRLEDEFKGLLNFK
jgi:hypothetical protein